MDAGGLVQPQRGQLLRLRGPPFLPGQQLRPRVAPPHRPGREHVTPPQRPVQLLQHAQRVGAVVDRPGGHVGGRRRPAAAMTRSSATRPPRPSSCTCRECFCLRVWEFSGFCGRPVRACTWIGRVRARACVHMVYSASGMSIIVHRLCRSGAMWSCRQERTVKPSAQPTLVRTQHLPHPGETARWLRKRGPAGRFFSVTPCTRVCHRGSMHSGGYGQIADSVRAERAVRSGSCTCRELVMDLSCTCRIPALLTRRIAGAEPVIFLARQLLSGAAPEVSGGLGLAVGVIPAGDALDLG